MSVRMWNFCQEKPGGEPAKGKEDVGCYMFTLTKLLQILVAFNMLPKSVHNEGKG